MQVLLIQSNVSLIHEVLVYRYAVCLCSDITKFVYEMNTETSTVKV